MSDLAKITITVPKDCLKRALSIDALDARTRDLAWQTRIEVDGKDLLCTAFVATYDNGKKPVLQLTVKDECFEIVEAKSNQRPYLPGDKRGIF
ncbi:MAG TPA: hypothetical protein VGO43_08240 [Pyrinomonadaceae bacterium]|jgi:hypothetical protein|nr:hypothetical protein [Pyrinomonadaceae bacterium]